MQRIGFVVFAGYQVMGFAAASVFEFANLSAKERLYDVRVMSEDGTPVASASAVRPGSSVRARISK